MTESLSQKEIAHIVGVSRYTIWRRAKTLPLPDPCQRDQLAVWWAKQRWQKRRSKAA